MASRSLSNFSPNGEYYAQSSPDGILKIWQTTSGVLMQEYTHSTHLSATCSCVSWGPMKKDEHKKSKKRRSSTGDALSRLDLIALGTTSGSLLLYSMVKGDLHTQLTGGHTDVVNSVCWNSRGDMLYSCSDDQHIVEWDVAKAQVKQKWKGDKGSINSIALCSSERHLLSASHAIKLWDIHTQEVLKTFTGHAMEVFSLLPVAGNMVMENGASEGHSDGETHADVDGTYFLSAAVGDRLLNAWQIKLSSKKHKNALGTFALPEEPVYMKVSQPRVAGQPILLLAITKSGQLLIFEHILNGPCKKPLQPRYTVQIATANAVPTPVLCAAVSGEGEDTDLLLGHGSSMRPTFEHVPYKSLEQTTCLIRDDPLQSAPQLQTSVSKVKTPGVSQDVTVLAPGHMAPLAPQRDEAGTRKKRRKSGELSMEEQLHALSVDAPSTSGSKGPAQRKPPKADHQAMLLAQGLQSNDKQILNSVLQTSNELMIRNTVRRLPLPVIVPLVLELTRRLHGHAQSGHNLIKWVRVVLTIHTSYLMTVPELVNTLSSLYQMIASRRAMFSRLAELQGKLDLVLSQVTSQGNEEEESTEDQALGLFQESDTDSDDVGLEELGVRAGSESEDNWEELSDMDDEDDEDDDDDEEEEEEEQQNNARGGAASRKRKANECEIDNGADEDSEAESDMSADGGE